MLNRFLKKEIKKASISKPSEEACGLLIETKTGVAVFHSENQAPKKKSQFMISPLDYIRASELGRIVGCYHSHVNNKDDFSEFDKKNAEKHKLTYVLYCLKDDIFLEYAPNSKKNEYLDREFILGRQDCFSLVRDYYRKEFGVKISNYPRNNQWFKQNPEIIFQNFDKEGFENVWKAGFDFGNLQKHDVLCMGFNDKQLFHFMVYLDNGIILHHSRNKLSTIENLTDFRKKRTKAVFRLKK